MIAAVDVGNSNVVFAVLEDGTVHFTERISTVRSRAALEYAALFRYALDLHHIPAAALKGGIVCSVVPQATEAVRQGLTAAAGVEVRVLGPETDTGIPLLVDAPERLGRDRLADVVGALARYEPPLIIFDFGTATTVTVVDAQGHCTGGLIYPGIQTSLEALVERAAQLGTVPLTPPEHLIGRNTEESLQSGALYSAAAAADGLIQRIRAEQGGRAVATGGLAELVVPLCREPLILDRELLLRGLWTIYTGALS